MTKALAGSPAAYYRRRERQERVTAERAASDVARRIHLELAARYAALLTAN